MLTISGLIYDGVLGADGTIHLDRPPEVRPGRVKVTLRPVTVSEAGEFWLPDPPWPDESVPAPCDLPLLGPREPVALREVDQLLPAPRHEYEMGEEEG